MRKLLPLIIFAFCFSTKARTQASSPYTTCPDVNIAIARAGDNSAINNPYYLYNVNPASGAMAQVAGGPFKDPASPASNLRVNGFGVSKKDGYIYSLVVNPTLTTTRFLRLDKNYGVTELGVLPTPSSPTAIAGLINTAAGETDTAGNFYFTAVTVKSATQIDKFFLGKISATNTLPSSTGSLPVTYYEIDLSALTCSDLVTSFSTDPENSGIKDFSYNAYTNTFFSYATYKPAGAPDFSAQLLELKPVAGSSPLRYQAVCNSIVNHHSAEVAGTLIDKQGTFGVLFTDGTYSVMNRNLNGTYNGTITQVAANAVTTLPTEIRADMGSCGQQTTPPPPSSPVTTCPNASFIVARAGLNADIQNPYFIYSVNTTTGAPALLPGPGLFYPSNPLRPIQVNGVGLNPADGYFYGLANEGTVTTAAFVRFDKNYGVKVLGDIATPTSLTGLVGIINAAAGDVDRSNNYYFTAFTANPTSATTYSLDKLFLGKISGISTLTGAANPAPDYYEIDYSDMNCSAYVASLSADPNNSGLKDLVYNPFTNTFISYVTYLPTGASSYSGQVVELKPIAGSSPLRYKMTCMPVVNNHSAEVSGTLIDNAGNFLVLLTDGSIIKIGSTVSYQYNGTFTVLNGTTGLPNPLRGDMASCSASTNAALPVTLSNFSVSSNACNNSFNWTTENESNFSRYELEESVDNVVYHTVSTVQAHRSLAASSYKVTLASPARTAYYRLKLVDDNGSATYSFILPVVNSCTGKAGFALSPNPASRQLHMNWYGLNGATKVDVMILNASGGVVAKTTQRLLAGSSTLTLDISALPGGAYWIKAVDATHNSSYESRFIKQ